MASTGENEQSLRKILDMTRMLSIAVFVLHFYHTCYGAFKEWGYTHPIGERLLMGLEKTGLFIPIIKTKAIALFLLGVSLIGVKGKKTEGLKWQRLTATILVGCCLAIFAQHLMLFNISLPILTCMYIGISSAGYLLVLAAGTKLSRIIRLKLSADVFNGQNESFPQEERLLTNEYSINLPARYRLKTNIRNSWINIINPFRGLLVVGSPGSGKSYFVIKEVIRQHIEKGFAMFVYDFKYPDLTLWTKECLRQNKKKYSVTPQFYVINFDDLSQSHRCNPLDPASMQDITDATESARTILLGLNREWIHKQGDFFVESPINFLTAVIWFLRKYEEGQFCTLPHVIELMQMPYEQLFPMLNREPEVEVLINPFISAYQNDAMEQLEGQVASAKIGMARLASPQLYWVLSGSEFTLDINNPQAPKIVCMGNNPEKQQIYGAVLSLYASRLVRQVNKRDKQKCSLVFDEFPTIYFNHIDTLIATARSNKVATTLGIQDFSQLKKDYGKDMADVVMNITGNIICGQVMGETAKQLSERFGKIMQDRESVSINRLDTSISRSKQLEYAIPTSKIASLSSGEFVGMVADNPEEKIALKMFHAEIKNCDPNTWKDAPVEQVQRYHQPIDPSQIMNNFHQVKLDIKNIFISSI